MLSGQVPKQSCYIGVWEGICFGEILKVRQCSVRTIVLSCLSNYKPSFPNEASSRYDKEIDSKYRRRKITSC